MSITVHHLELSRSHRIVWLLEELGVDYEIIEYARDPKTLRAPPELRELHPLGKSPVVTVDEVVLAESGAIVEELVERFGPLLKPSDAEGLRLYRYWLHYAEGSLMPPLLVKLLMNKVRKAPLPFFLKPIAKAIPDKLDGQYTDPEIQKQFAFIEQELSGRDHFAGDAFSAADIMLSYPIEARGLPLQPATQAWVDRMHARPAYQRASERAGPVASP